MITQYKFLPDKQYLLELRRPWKLVTFSIGMSWLIYGALSYGISDWDIGISLIMGGLTYLCAPWSVYIIFNAARFKPRGWPLHIIAAFLPALFTVDWSYWLYHTMMGNKMLRWENFKVSSALYFICGSIWYYKGSMHDMINNIKKIQQAQQPSYFKPVLLGFILIVFDALIINQGVLACLVVIWQLFVGIPGIIRSSSSGIRRFRLVCLAIYLGAAIVVFSSNMLNNRIAHYRAELLVSAIKEYTLTEHRYPETLQDLVPRYISTVPLAKYTLMFNNFNYSSKNHYLFYVSFPPFTRPTYSFDSGKWQVID